MFKSVFPIKDFNEVSSLEFVCYHLEKPKYDVDECHQRGMTFSAPIKVVVRLVVWDKDEETGAQSIRDVKEQEVYFGEIPLDDRERDLHHQRHRAGGRQPAPPFAGRVLRSRQGQEPLLRASCSTTPASSPTAARGSTSSSTTRTCSTCRIDRRRKLPATVLLRALGGVPDTSKKSPMEFHGSTEEILNYYYDTETIYIVGKDKFEKSVELDLLPGQRATRDIKNAKTGEVLVKKNRKFTRGAIKKIEAAKIKTLPMDADATVDQGLRLRRGRREPPARCSLECNEEVTQEKVELLREKGMTGVQDPLHRRAQRGPVPARHAQRRQDRPRPRRHRGDLPPPAAG